MYHDIHTCVPPLFPLITRQRPTNFSPRPHVRQGLGNHRRTNYFQNVSFFVFSNGTTCGTKHEHGGIRKRAYKIEQRIVVRENSKTLSAARGSPVYTRLALPYTHGIICLPIYCVVFI